MFYIKSLLIDVLLVASFSSDYDSKLPIVLFVGQHFSGSLFESIYLSLHMYKALDAHA